ncbi:hypothetical protein [Staphylococcus capitis]|uniref:hypothetical protein n=1 Tax=Staphylococcus capitis TaxID=29388 RepID=UPI003CFEC23E
MNHKTTQSDWRMVASCLASQNYISIVKGLIHHFTAISCAFMPRKFIDVEKNP